MLNNSILTALVFWAECVTITDKDINAIDTNEGRKNVDKIFLYATFFFVGMMVLSLILNVFYTAKKEKPSVWGTRGLYGFGILAAIANGIRMVLTAHSDKGTLIFANVIVIICLVIGLIRSEKGDPMMEKIAEEEQK